MMNGVRSQLVCGLLIGSAVLCGRARAEAPVAAPTAAPAAPATAPDLVRLKNGGMLRGTIAESEPGDSVTIVLLTGETRKIAAADVTYAGPANAAPPSAPPSPVAAAPAQPPPARPADNGDVKPFAVVHAAEARVDFVSEPGGNSLYRRSSTASYINNRGNVPIAAGYEEVCTAPCNASMPSGTHTFAIAKSGGSPIEADPIALPPGNSTLRATYHDRSGTRVALIVVGAAGMAGGLVAQLDGFNKHPMDGTEVAVGSALEVAALVVLLCSNLATDRVDLTISPGVAAPAQAGDGPRDTTARFMDAPRSRAESARDGLSGLTLTARF